MNDPWARLPARTAKVKAGDPDLVGALKATSAEIGAGLVHTLHSIPIWARDDPQHGAVPVTSSVDDLGPFRRKLQQQEHSVTAELVGGAFDPADMTIVQDALDIGAMDLDNYPENARWFAARPEHASSAEDRWWGLMLATAAKRGDDNARRFPRLRAEYFTRADQIFERARDLVFLYEADYRMWSVTPNPALAGVGARIAYAVRTYPDRHRFDNWFYSMEPEEGVRRMLRDEHPELLVALDEVARMPGTTTWWPLPRPRPSHDDDDDPWYETATEVGIAIIPFIGEAVMAYEAVLGYDLFGHELSAGARAIRVVGVALPTLGRLAGETRAAISWEGAAVREEDRFIAEAPSARTASDTAEKVRARTAADIAAEDIQVPSAAAETIHEPPTPPPGAAATTEQVTSPPPAAEVAQFQQRQGQLAKLKEPALKKLVGDPESPKDPAALAELTRRFEQRSKLELVQMMRRDSKFNGPIAASVLARGKGVPVSEAGYAEFMANGGSIEVLRDAALVDRAALHELITQYRQLPPPELERLRAAGDSIADQVSSEPDPGPRMRADADERMTEAIWERRRTAIEQAEVRLAAAVGVRPTRAAERALAAATHDGTIGAMETDIPGVTELTVRGSPEAPQGADPGPGPNRRYQPPESHDPAKPLPESAHHHAEDRFVNHLDAEFQRLGITQQQLIGRTVRISVDQAVCQTCAAGVAGSRNGVLLQFSADHPGLRIEVADINTGSLSVFEGGVRTGHYERVPTYAEP